MSNKETKPLISIITPTYNRAGQIKDAIESVVNQKKDIQYNREMLICDDGSIDNTKSIVQKYIDLYPQNIKYFKQENKGVGAARNTCLDNMSKDSTYTILLDSDDELTVDCVYTFLKQYNELKEVGEYEKTLGFYFLCETEEGRLVGSKNILHNQYRRALTYNDFLNNDISFEMLSLFKSNIFTKGPKFRFPVISDLEGLSKSNKLNFVSEGVMRVTMWKYMDNNGMNIYVSNYIGRLYKSIEGQNTPQLTKVLNRDKFEMSALSNQKILDIMKRDIIDRGYICTHIDYLFRIGINWILFGDKQKGLSLFKESFKIKFSLKIFIIYIVSTISPKLLLFIYKQYI